MYVRGLILLVACFPPILAVRGEDDDVKPAADPVQAVLDRVAKMPTAQQQAWLRRLEQRAARATRLTLPPDEAARHEARIRSLLYRKLITWQMLREAIEETDARERDTLDRLIRSYRSHILDTFHKRLDVYDRWQGAWTAAHQDWKAAGAEFEQQDRLIDWLEAAIRNADPHAIGPIPEKPTFERRRPAAAALEAVKWPADDAKPQAAARPAKPHVVKRPIDGSVEVKIDELAARIAGCNMAFRALESDLDEKGTWNAARLEPLADRLEILVIRRRDLNLFREAVPEKKRSAVKRLETPKSAISQLGARIFEARKNTGGPGFQGGDAERRAELARLEALSSRLAELAH